MGPVLYSLSEVARGVGATQRPVVATLHQPVKDTGPHTLGPCAGCGRGASRTSWEMLSPAFQRALGAFSVSGDLVRAGLELLEPRVLFTPRLPTLYLASVCPFVFHVFLPSVKSVCLVCLFLNSFTFPRLRMKVHVHSVPTLSSLAMPRPTPSLLGLRPSQRLLRRFPFPTGKGLCSIFQHFPRKNICEDIVTPVPEKWTCFCARVTGKVGLGILGH